MERLIIPGKENDSIQINEEDISPIRKPVETIQINPVPIQISMDNSIDKNLIKLVKSGLKENKITISELIENKIVLGSEGEGGQEYEVVMIPDLVVSLTPICGTKFEKQDGLENFLRSLVGNNESYILVDTLKNIFGGTEEDLEESEDDNIILEHVNELNEESLEIIQKIIDHLQTSNITAMDFFNRIMQKQNVVVNEITTTVDVIDSNKFYELLIENKLIEKESENLSEFLCLDKEYINVFLMKKLLKLINYVKNNKNSESIH